MSKIKKKLKKINKNLKEKRTKHIERLKKRRETFEKKFIAGIQFQRWTYYITFIQTVMGFYLAAGSIARPDLYEIITVFFIFGPMMYGGLYTLNDVFDIEYDKNNPKKSKRPLISNKVSVKEAYFFGLSSIGAALILTMLLEPDLIYLALSFIAINLLYSWKLKHIPIIDIISNSLTHPLRVYLGYAIAGVHIPRLFILGWFLVTSTFATLRRQRDKRKNQSRSRPVIRFYNDTIFRVIYFIDFLGILLIIPFVGDTESTVLTGAFILTFICVGLYFRVRWIRKFIELTKF